MRYRRKRQPLEAAELNITAFMNLMVILIPFLLITAVFSRMTVLELNFPGADAQESTAEMAERLQLQMVVTRERIVIRDARMGLIRKLDRKDGEEPWNALRDTLLEIKTKFPEETSIALLLESDASYDLMMQMMDRIASTQQLRMGTVERVELFPDISLGKAPIVEGAA